MSIHACFEIPKPHGHIHHSYGRVDISATPPQQRERGEKYKTNNTNNNLPFSQHDYYTTLTVTTTHPATIATISSSTIFSTISCVDLHTVHRHRQSRYNCLRLCLLSHSTQLELWRVRPMRPKFVTITMNPDKKRANTTNTLKDF